VSVSSGSASAHTAATLASGRLAGAAAPPEIRSAGGSAAKLKSPPQMQRHWEVAGDLSSGAKLRVITTFCPAGSLGM
jgi:hypothetical protein